MFFGKPQNKELEKFATVLKEGIEALFMERGEIKFSAKPELTRQQIIEYEGKIRANGIEKFGDEITYVSAVNFYANAVDLEKKKTLGTLIIYVPKIYLPKMMKTLQYPPVDDEDENSMLDSIGTLCNIIAGRFKSEIKNAGYVDLEMSHFINYKNNAVVGIDFCRSEYEYYEFYFEIDGERRLAIDMTIGTIPKR